MKKNMLKGTVWILWKELSAVRSLFSPMASALTGKVGGKSLRNKIKKKKVKVFSFKES